MEYLSKVRFKNKNGSLSPKSYFYITIDQSFVSGQIWDKFSRIKELGLVVSEGQNYSNPVIVESCRSSKEICGKEKFNIS